MIYAFRFWFRLWRDAGFGVVRSAIRGMGAAWRGANPRTAAALHAAYERRLAACVARVARDVAALPMTLTVRGESVQQGTGEPRQP